jgi:spore maturation protein CgeB
MKILILGSIGRTSVEVAGFCRNAFEELGHTAEVSVYNDHRLSARFRPIRFAEKKVIQQMLLRRIQALRPDFILVIKGDCLDAGLLDRIRRRHSIPIVNFWIDDPLYLHFSLTKSPHYDLFFTNARQCLEAHRQVGCKNIRYLSFGFDRRLHRKMELTENDRLRFGSGISFTGTLTDRRIEMLRPLVGMNLRIWSTTLCTHLNKDGIWSTPIPEENPLLSHVTGISLWGDDMVRACNAAAIVLNLHVQDTPTMRDFEVPACGGFLMTDYVPGLEEFFEIGSEIVCFRSPEELRALAEYYLANGREREAIAEKGYARARRDHSYTARMKTILEAVERL